MIGTRLDDETRLARAVVVALGGNLPVDGEPVQAILEAALAQLMLDGFKISVHSSWWRSRAWPDPSDPPFVNGVAIVETVSDPVATLAALHRVEARFGRRRSTANAPRPLDLDLIAYGRAVIDAPGLVLPHPRAHERAFVMGPLAEIAPGWVHPLLGRTAAELAARATIGMDAQPLEF